MYNSYAAHQSDVINPSLGLNRRTDISRKAISVQHKYYLEVIVMYINLQKSYYLDTFSVSPRLS
jgi:hypothetical protein